MAAVVDAAAAVAVSLEVEVVAAGVVAVFRGAAAAASRAPAAEISREEVSVAPVGLVREIFPAPAEAVVWLIPETPHRAREVPLAAASD
ncbi:MAG: hypothetical protein JO077_09240 [Verrucomicrobia bacterium]|nr:hypothetical protein [Verrucomicrobiota bacterium]